MCACVQVSEQRRGRTQSSATHRGLGQPHLVFTALCPALVCPQEKGWREAVLETGFQDKVMNPRAFSHHPAVAGE